MRSLRKGAKRFANRAAMSHTLTPPLRQRGITRTPLLRRFELPVGRFEPTAIDSVADEVRYTSTNAAHTIDVQYLYIKVVYR